MVEWSTSVAGLVGPCVKTISFRDDLRLFFDCGLAIINNGRIWYTHAKIEGQVIFNQNRKVQLMMKGN